MGRVIRALLVCFVALISMHWIALIQVQTDLSQLVISEQADQKDAQFEVGTLVLEVSSSTSGQLLDGQTFWVVSRAVEIGEELGWSPYLSAQQFDDLLLDGSAASIPLVSHDGQSLYIAFEVPVPQSIEEANHFEEAFMRRFGESVSEVIPDLKLSFFSQQKTQMILDSKIRNEIRNLVLMSLLLASMVTFILVRPLSVSFCFLAILLFNIFVSLAIYSKLGFTVSALSTNSIFLFTACVLASLVHTISSDISRNKETATHSIFWPMLLSTATTASCLTISLAFTQGGVREATVLSIIGIVIGYALVNLTVPLVAEWRAPRYNQQFKSFVRLLLNAKLARTDLSIIVSIVAFFGLVAFASSNIKIADSYTVWPKNGIAEIEQFRVAASQADFLDVENIALPESGLSQRIGSEILFNRGFNESPSQRLAWRLSNRFSVRCLSAFDFMNASLNSDPELAARVQQAGPDFLSTLRSEVKREILNSRQYRRLSNSKRAIADDVLKLTMGAQSTAELHSVLEIETRERVSLFVPFDTRFRIGVAKEIKKQFDGAFSEASDRIFREVEPALTSSGYYKRLGKSRDIEYLQCDLGQLNRRQRVEFYSGLRDEIDGFRRDWYFAIGFQVSEAVYISERIGVLSSQSLRGLLITGVAIVLFFFVVSRSVKWTFVASLMNALPMLILLSSWQAVNGYVGLAVITGLATIIGILIDDTIYIWFSNRRSLALPDSVLDNEERLLRPIVATSIVLFVTCSPLLLSQISVSGERALVMMISLALALLFDAWLLFSWSSNFRNSRAVFSLKGIWSRIIDLVARSIVTFAAAVFLSLAFMYIAVLFVWSFTFEEALMKFLVGSASLIASIALGILSLNRMVARLAKLSHYCIGPAIVSIVVAMALLPLHRHFFERTNILGGDVSDFVLLSTEQIFYLSLCLATLLGLQSRLFRSFNEK